MEMEVATKSFRLLRIKECGINTIVWHKGHYCVRNVASATKLPQSVILSQIIWTRKCGRFSKNTAKQVRQSVHLVDFSPKVWKKVSKTRIKRISNVENVENVEGWNRYYHWYIRIIRVFHISTFIFPNLGRVSSKVFYIFMWKCRKCLIPTVFHDLACFENVEDSEVF